MRLKLTFFFLICLWQAQLFGQSPTHQAYGVDSDYKSMVSWVLFKDSRGIIWSGPLGNGAKGYNGKSFFTLTEKDGLAGDIALSYAEDNKGNLWIGCQGQGLSIYDGKKFTNYNKNDSVGLNSNNVLSMFQHSNGDFYLGTYQGGLHRYNDGKFEVIGDSTSVIYDIIEDEAGVLWFGTKDNGLGRYDGESITYLGAEEEFIDHMILDISFDKEKNILIPTNGGLYRYQKDGSFYRYNDADGFPDGYKFDRCLVLDNGDFLLSRSGHPYLYSEGELQRLDLHGKDKDGITGIVQDNSGNVWLSTNGNGLIHLYLNGVSVVSGPEELGIKVLCQLPDGKITYANKKGIYQFWNNQVKEVHVFEGKLKSLRGIWQQDSINLYMSGEFGLMHFNMQTKEYSLVYNQVIYGLMPESDSTIVFCELEGGTRYNLLTNKATNITPEGEKEPYVSVAVGDKGEVYFGSYTEGGIIEISEGSTIKYNETNGLDTDAKIDLDIDSKGQLWYLSVSGNFGFLREGEFTSFKSGLNGGADGFVIDKEDNIWISGINGVVYIQMNDNQIVGRQYLGINEGIHMGNSEMGQGMVDLNGRVYFPKQEEDLYVIDPEKLKTTTELPQLYIESAMGKDYSELDSNWYSGYSPLWGVPDSLVLPYDDNSLSLVVNCVYFSLPDSVYYAYKLREDDEWSQPQSSSLISFTNISAGDYSLQIKAIVPSGESEILVYNFIVLTPWFQSWWFYTIIIVGFFLFIYLIFKWRMSKLQKDKEQLEAIVVERTKEVSEEKEKVSEAFMILEEKNQEIVDSIAYAKRIQSAILPPDALVTEMLPESFVLYMPKDVVAGDFYWLEPLTEATSEKQLKSILFAAADCTGHGVPGAMVSVICNGALNRSVREFEITDPGLLLDKAREIVIQEFEKSEEEVKDGMDIALCHIEGLKLKFAGANNPLWIVRDSELIEIKADKQPIGKFEAAKPFTTHEFELKKNDLVYVFTDGYVDQFGGEKGKKFRPKSLRTLLLSIEHESMERQHEILYSTIETWRGSLEQVDDICIIGVRV